ncbi:MAG: 16S rRNA (adenine(1518)-N(6)/adenine(1519)-N(6))-dimethyltransferase RsmA [bacterium]|jgi:16S rRNA (adenine1518-N6/adenine1519-N6)-dimethyltransferase
MTESNAPVRIPGSVRKQLEALGVSPRKQRGQSFLVSPRAASHVVQAADLTPDDAVIEIGPGLGALTDYILRTDVRLVAIECDARLAKGLRINFRGEKRFELIESDVLRIDLHRLARRMGEGGRTVKVISNVPYSISGPLIGNLLEVGNVLELLVLTVQRELATRIAAPVGGKDYGVFTVFCQYHADVKKLFTIPPSAFYPRPRVMSTVLLFTPRRQPPVDVVDERSFFSMVRLLFSQRRKTINAVLRRAVRGTGGKGRLAEIFSAADVSPSARPEQLDLAALAALCNALYGVDEFKRVLTNAACRANGGSGVPV